MGTPPLPVPRIDGEILSHADSTAAIDRGPGDTIVHAGAVQVEQNFYGTVDRHDLAEANRRLVDELREGLRAGIG